MKYQLYRHDGQNDENTGFRFNNYKEVLKFLNKVSKISGNQTNSTEIIATYRIKKIIDLPQEEISCRHCKRTANNGIKCLGMCVADNEY